ncbi:10507_t:CDS:2 [Ambispora gerdemannii]|uniref:10507_t:CDS:1 n=1 Tax=Ambispora gerdemannii TaxID=144530 RepID=A0A9N8Z8M1_9GLOM|nr:10507_t:CDS:2 [Ambispora gerdemannii]
MKSYHCERCNSTQSSEEERYATMDECQHCTSEFIREQFDKWTSGNEKIDREIQEAQLNSPVVPLSLGDSPRIIEWIPFEDLLDVKPINTIGKGDVTIYKAVLAKGFAQSFDYDKRTILRAPQTRVVLRHLVKSEQINEEFLQELKEHLLLQSRRFDIVDELGITKNSQTGDYFLVEHEMKQNLKEYMIENYSTITWTEIYDVFTNLSRTLHEIHHSGITHRNIHWGNVLLREYDNAWVFSNPGSASLANDNTQANKLSVYGKLPFMAPEILKENAYSAKSDIYAFGMLMYMVMTVGSFIGYADNVFDLIYRICNGKWPMFPSATTSAQKRYLDLVERCLKTDPAKRPDARELMEFFYRENKTQEPKHKLLFFENLVPAETPRKNNDYSVSKYYSVDDIRNHLNKRQQDDEKEFTKHQSHHPKFPSSDFNSSTLFSESINDTTTTETGDDIQNFEILLNEKFQLDSGIDDIGGGSDSSFFAPGFRSSYQKSNNINNESNKYTTDKEHTTYKEQLRPSDNMQAKEYNNRNTRSNESDPLSPSSTTWYQKIFRSLFFCVKDEQ